MRGKNIHNNGADGRGLIAADNRQLPFEIGHWRSDTAPAINTTVDLVLAGDAIDAVTRVPDEVLLKEKASKLAGKLGSAGDAALQSLRDSAPRDATQGIGAGWSRLGKPVLIAQAIFALSALALPYLAISTPFGGGRSFTLAGLSEISQQLGSPVGSTFWLWLAIASIGVPMFVRHRLAWLALLLPLFAVIKPVIDMAAAARQASRQLGGLMGSDMSGQIAQQIADMLQPGIGAWLCLFSALFLAAVGAKRTLLPSN